ncbi:putative exonuclease mut-7 [Toxocara canis]|uniref:Putative exonuclease mut-7 n=1 Tax=Toxocara canis TaxID=6265 RepID=A0A0B2UV31_TOXCA|nr:putative exonuclease mut-7 [Toxocara canis]
MAHSASYTTLDAIDGEQKSEQPESDDLSQSKDTNEIAPAQCKKTKEEKKEEFKPPPLPEPLGTWRKVLKEVWISEAKDMKLELCQKILNNIFSISDNPLEDVLSLLKVCPDYSTQKSSTLAGYVVQYFAKWLVKCDRSELYEKCLTHELMIKALEAGTCKHTTHLETIARIYKLKGEEMMRHALDAVKKLLELKNYRDAVNCAAIFGLQREISLGQIVIPCLLQNGSVAVEVYLKDHKDLQMELVKFFDNFVGMSDDKVRERFKALYESDVIPIATMKMQGKTLEKLVAKLLTFYGLRGDEAAPNLTRCRQEGSLRYIVSKHFVEKTMSEESYTDYISHALREDEHLQHYLVRYLYRMGEVDDAVRWVIYCDMGSNVPRCIRNELSSKCQGMFSGRLHHALREDEHLQHYLVRYLYRMGEVDDAVRWVIYCDMGSNVPRCIRNELSETRIQKAEQKISALRELRKDAVDVSLYDGHPVIMVDTVAALKQFRAVFDTSEVIGIDTEWKPMFLSTVEQVALLQISIPSCSYLVDVVKLEEEATEEQWTEFFKALFCTQSSVKLGFDFANDMRVLRASFPFLESMQTDMKNIICVMKLVNSVISENSTFLDLPAGEPQTSDSNESAADESCCDEQLHFKLTDLCYKVLGEPLDKREQVGNWAARPLRPEQMKYAAMDAYCLIQIYERLKRRAEEEFGMNWQNHVENANIVQVKPKTSKKGRKKAVKVDDDELRQIMERVNAAIEESAANGQRPKDIKVIVDSMMLGLGKHLRRCGIDTVLAETRDFLVECAKKDRERFILTSGKAYDELRRNRLLRGSDRILYIPSVQSMNAIEQIEFVLKRFHIRLTKEDIFSRCMEKEEEESHKRSTRQYRHHRKKHQTTKKYLDDPQAASSIPKLVIPKPSKRPPPKPPMCNEASFVIGPSPVLEAMYQANVVALQPFNDEPYDANKYNQKMLQGKTRRLVFCENELVDSNHWREEPDSLIEIFCKNTLVNADDYSGYGCTLTINEHDKEWATARCFNGVLDVRNCLVLALNRDAPSLVQIEKVPLPVLEKQGRFFYVCGNCGKVYWDGCHIVNYNTFAETLFADETTEN